MLVDNVKVFHDGSHYIARLTKRFSIKRRSSGGRFDNLEYEKFKKYYQEAVGKNVAKWKIWEYVQDRFIEENESLFDIPDEETVKGYIKRYVSMIHKRIVRYRRKVYFNDWSYFTTFTYDNKKITQEEFEKQISTKLSDLSSHRGWYYMMRWEEGELAERTHLHAFIYVPDGQMVGKLFQDRHYSYKRHRWEFFTNNTYFNNRFGISDWVDLKAAKISKTLINYFAKYMSKNDGKIIYSRGIPGEIEAEIDVEEDVITTYEKHYAFYGVLDRFMFDGPEEKQKTLRRTFKLSEVQIASVPI